MLEVPAFEIADLDEAFSLVEARVAGTVVVRSGDAMEASLLPWRLIRGAPGAVRLEGHVARGNPLVALLDRPIPGIVLFDVLDGYVSPSWYPSKREHGRVVPTWNYVSVHLHGTVRAVDDPRWLHANVSALTDANEARSGSPWSVGDAPAGFVDGMLRRIVGIECVVARIQAKAKLSQNRSAADAEGVIEALAEVPGAAALREAMLAAGSPDAHRRSGSAAGGLLEDDPVAVGVVEGHEPPPRSGLDLPFDRDPTTP
jgi:transcriptional regulator